MRNIHKSALFFNADSEYDIESNLITVFLIKIHWILPRSIKTESFTIRKQTVTTVKTGYLRRYTVSIRSVFGPYRTVLSGAVIRTVLYPFRKRTVYWSNTLCYPAPLTDRFYNVNSPNFAIIRVESYNRHVPKEILSRQLNISDT